MQAGASGGMTMPIITPIIVGVGSVKATGSNSYGELGDGTTTNKSTPVISFSDVSDVKECFTSFQHTVCVMNDGTVKTAGSNQYGQLGTTTNSGTTNPNPNPNPITTDFNNAKQCSAGNFHTVCSINGTREELPTCNSVVDDFAMKADGTKYICQKNSWIPF